MTPVAVESDYSLVERRNSHTFQCIPPFLTTITVVGRDAYRSDVQLDGREELLAFNAAKVFPGGGRENFGELANHDYRGAADRNSKVGI